MSCQEQLWEERPVVPGGAVEAPEDREWGGREGGRRGEPLKLQVVGTLIHEGQIGDHSKKRVSGQCTCQHASAWREAVLGSEREGSHASEAPPSQQGQCYSLKGPEDR